MIDEMGTHATARLTLTLALFAIATFTACDRSTNDSPAAPTTPAINTFTGTWRSTSNTPNGACSAMNWTIAPTGATTATITYSATCSRVPINGTANATLNGTTLNWSTTGTAGNGCAYGLNGTAAPTNITDLRVDYGGTVCGAPVTGTEVLHR